MSKSPPKPLDEAVGVLVEPYREEEENRDIDDSADLPPDDGPFMAEQSQMAPEDPADYQKARSVGKPGRPPGSGKVSDTGILGGKPLPVPRPHIRVYRSDAIGAQKRNTSFYAYWNGLPAWAKTYTQAYVYRQHPVLKDPPLDPVTKKATDFKYIDKIAGEQPLQSDHDLLNKYGCGSYKIVFNEMSSPHDKRNSLGGELCEVYCMNVGGGDYKSNPPTDRRINLIENLELSDPNNAAYIGFLRGKGIIPEEINKQKEAEEMATIQAAQSVAEQQGRTIETLTSKVVEMAERTHQQPPPSQIRAEDISRAVQDGVRAVLLEMKQQTPVAPVANPMDTAIELFKLIDSAKSGSTAEVSELRNTIAQMQQSQLTATMDQMKTLLESRTSGATSTSPFGGVADGLEALKKMKDTFEDLGIPMGGVTGNPAEDALPSGVPKWLPYVAPIGQQLIGVLGQWLAGRGQVQTQPQPMQQPAYPSQPQPPYNPMPTNGGLPAPVQANPANPSTLPPELTRLLDAITYPLLNYLEDPGTVGGDFANWFMSGFGDETFVQIKGFGVDGIMGALAAHPPTAQTLSNIPLERLTKFIREFVEADPADDGEKEEETGKPGPVPVVTPVAS